MGSVAAAETAAQAAEEMLQKAEMLVSLTGERVAAIVPDRKALQADTRAIDKITDAIDHFRFSDLPPDQIEVYQSGAAAVRAALRTTHKVAEARLLALE